MKNFALAALIAAAPFAAHADSITLDKPLAGATLHAEAVDMSVYVQPKAEAIEVTARYQAGSNMQNVGQLIMSLNDGDSVEFGLPGILGESYSFSRSGDTVSVWNSRTGFRTASN